MFNTQALLILLYKTFTLEKNQFSIFESELRVRPDDIDMLNHVHSSKYLDYVLAARYEQMEKFYGMPLSYFFKMGKGWVISKVNIQYKRPLVMNDTMIIKTGVLSINEKRCVVQFQIINKKTNKIASDGLFDFVLIDLKTQKAIPISAEMIEAYCI